VALPYARVPRSYAAAVRPVLVFTQTTDGVTLLQYRCMKTVRQIAMCVTSSVSCVHRIVPVVPVHIQRIDLNNSLLLCVPLTLIQDS